MRNGPRGPVELYDLKVDPGEKTNLAEQNADVLRKATALMSSARTDDPNWPMKEAPARRQAAAPAALN